MTPGRRDRLDAYSQVFKVEYMMTLFWIVACGAALYLILTLYLSLLVQQIPRRPVKDTPDWGEIEDIFISAVDGGKLEVWRIEQEGDSRGIVLLAHGWGRNRDRMVNRARIFGSMGFTTVIHSDSSTRPGYRQAVQAFLDGKLTHG